MAQQTSGRGQSLYGLELRNLAEAIQLNLSPLKITNLLLCIKDIGLTLCSCRKHEKETATFERSDNLYSKPLAYQSSEKRYTNST